MSETNSNAADAAKEQELQEKRKDAEEKIWKNWETAWNAEASDRKTEFYTLLKANYFYIAEKAKKNREKNFDKKQELLEDVKFTAWVQALIGLASAWFYGCGFLDLSVFLVIFLGSAALQSAVLYAKAKNLEVQKYQETWVRHQSTKYKLQVEMVKYYQGLAPYNLNVPEEKESAFMLQVLSILDKSNQKFESNMEDKETTLADLPEKVSVSAWKDIVK